MFSVTLSEQQQKVLAKSLVLFLSRYKHISDSYIIEFFSENLWETLPEGWQKALRDLSPPQVADLLLHRDPRYRVYPSVWPLSLLALRATAHTLAFPRMSSAHQSKDTVKLDEFPSNSSQSSLLGHIFRKHVKPKKQHEIRKLGMLVKQLCDQTQCSSVVDVGSGQGHLTRFLSFGLGLNVTAVEADPNLVFMASKFDGQLLSTMAKESRKTGISHTALDPVPRHVVGWINPRDTWESFLQQLGEREKNSESYPATAGSCKKRQRVSMTSDKERELETELVCGSQHLCTGDCSLVAYVDENPARSALLQHEKESNDCVARSDTVMAEFHLQTGFGWDSSTHPEVCSSVKEPVCSDFVLTGLHACGDLSATLLRHFANCPHVQGITSVACCYMKITTEENPTPPGVIIPSLSENTNEVSQAEYGYPMSDWVRRLPGHELSYKAREGACHAIEDYLHRLRDESSLLKTHCYRAALESIIRAERPQLRRAGIQTIKKAHMLSFAEYARLGLTRVGLPADLTFDPVNVEGLLEQQGRVVVYFSLALLLAPVVETLVLLDRMLFLQERGFQSHLIPLFDPALSPRNFVLVAMKPKKDGEEVIQQNSSHQSSAITAQNPQNVQD
ncbi:protein RRNAD1 isoform X1 [Tachysurus fulvidraco]|uniref:protein RRNAD1 isoform X1 n=1 Tax=Tachysurus fulvidraco TaxID=1234273 RepID=UPI001FEDD229|nr:protein RRNAD1 isoform X1 [Tachysurus fulvidraco]